LTNLRREPKHQKALDSARRLLTDWLLDTRDTGFMPEPLMHRLSANSTPYEFAHSDRYPLQEILTIAQFQVSGLPGIDRIQEYLNAEDPLLRYWMLQVLAYFPEKIPDYLAVIKPLMADEQPTVRVSAASLVFSQESSSEAFQTIMEALHQVATPLQVFAARALELAPDAAKTPYLDSIQSFYTAHCSDTGSRYCCYDIYSCWSLKQLLKNYDPN